MQASESSNSKINTFLERNKNYIETIVNMGNFLKVTLKANVIVDKQKYREIFDEAKSIGGKAKDASFLFPQTEAKTLEKTLGVPSEYKLLILHENDIEQGGPQPRLKIIDDPETRALAEAIKQECQREPIDTYPSPLNNGKHRICEGHRRYAAIFGILKPQGILDYIIAKEKKRSELEAWQDAWILNDKAKLSDYEKGAYIVELQKRFSEAYPNQEALAKKLGISQTYVARLIQCYEEIEHQNQNPNVMPRGIMERIPEGTVREARKAPVELKPVIYEKIVENQLSGRETKQLVEAVKAEEAPTENTVQEKAALLFEDVEKESKKFIRSKDKLMDELVPYYPEELVNAVFGSFCLYEDKITVEKVRDRCQTVVGLLVQRALKNKSLDEDIREASVW